MPTDLLGSQLSWFLSGLVLCCGLLPVFVLWLIEVTSHQDRSRRGGVGGPVANRLAATAVDDNTVNRRSANAPPNRPAAPKFLDNQAKQIAEAPSVRSANLAAQAPAASQPEPAPFAFSPSQVTYDASSAALQNLLAAVTTDPPADKAKQKPKNLIPELTIRPQFKVQRDNGMIVRGR
jgi:hypothetical protein